MQKNELLQWNNTIIRILAIDDTRVLVIDCVKRTMPQWINSDALSECKPCEKTKLELQTEIELDDFENMNIQERRIAHERYTMIAGILPFVVDESLRSLIIDKIADEKKVSKQTVRRYLCLYLAFDDMSVLCSRRKKGAKSLTEDEKNIRWALNKFFYTSRKNSLQTAYTLMLKEKYCDKNGALLPEYPTIHQFRYFYRKNKKMQTYYISRNGLKDYSKAFELTEEGFHWLGDYEITADELLGGITPKANKKERAKQLIYELAETNNVVKSEDIVNLAEEKGISKRTLENAKKELGIKGKRIGESWYWNLDEIVKA